jgi:hypothetical protein
MQRFQIGDRVLIIPRYAHLYPANTGIIADVDLDPRRGILNEYVVKFADASTANLFEFQLQRDVSHYQTSIAALAFDTSVQTPVVPFRGTNPDRHLLLRTAELDIDMKIYWLKTHASIIGQILERLTTDFISDAEVILMNRNLTGNTTTTDSQGVFMFTGLGAGLLEIQILLHGKALRIFGSFTM